MKPAGTGAIPSRRFSVFLNKHEVFKMNKKNDILSAAAVILFAAAFYTGSFQIQQTTSDVLGSRFFPQAAAILLAFLGIVQIVTALTASGKGSAENNNTDDIGAKKQEGISVPFILTIAALFAYYVLIRLVGFAVTSIAYLLFESWVLMPEEGRNSKKMKIIVILTSFLVPLFLNYIFYQVFKIRLPQGMLFG